MGSAEFDNDAKNFSERTFSFVTNIGIFAADAADGIRMVCKQMELLPISSDNLTSAFFTL